MSFLLLIYVLRTAISSYTEKTQCKTEHKLNYLPLLCTETCFIKVTVDDTIDFDSEYEVFFSCQYNHERKILLCFYNLSSYCVYKL